MMGTFRTCQAMLTITLLRDAPFSFFVYGNNNNNIAQHGVRSSASLCPFLFESVSEGLELGPNVM